MTDAERRLITITPDKNGQKSTNFERRSYQMAHALYLEILKKNLAGHLRLDKKENELVGNINVDGKFSYFNEDVMISFWETQGLGETEPRFGTAFCIGVSEGMPLNRYFFRLWASENHFYEMASGRKIPYYSFELCGTPMDIKESLILPVKRFNPRISKESTDLTVYYPRKASLNRINREIELDRIMT